MAIFQYGKVIKERREAMGISQEALAHGICSVTTLSRIENGERLPTQNHLEALMERLGCSGLLLDNAVSETDFQIHELKFQIRQAYINGRQEELKKLLADYEARISSTNKADQQFLALYQILPVLDHYTAEERLQKFEDALKLTCPDYQADRLPGLLSYEEIILLNGIANSYAGQGDRSRGIEIFYALKRYYENHIVNTEEALRTQPMILYNLSKNLGLEGRYDECIEVCNLGIRIARETGRCSLLHKILFNGAWALVSQNKPENQEIARSMAKKAYYMACIMEKTKSAELYAQFIYDNFKENVSL